MDFFNDPVGSTDAERRNCGVYLRLKTVMIG